MILSSFKNIFISTCISPPKLRGFHTFTDRIPDLNPWSSGVQHHDFVAVPVWVRCELGTYTEEYGVYTDRQGSNTDVAGKAPGVNPDYTDEHGSN